MTYKPFDQCERILLDSTVIIEALMTESEGDEILFVRELLDRLNSRKTKSGHVRKFIFSDITISELVTLSSVEEFARTISPILNTSNSEIRPFDSKCAIWINKNFEGMLSAQKQKEYARKVGFPEHELKMAREWISKDMMIISTAVQNGADLILTADSRTFKPLADRVGVQCVITRRPSFQEDLFGKAHWQFSPNLVQEKK